MQVSNFGRNIKALRDREGISQYKFADDIDVTQTTVSSWETRGKQPRSKDVVNRICNTYRVTEQDL